MICASHHAYIQKPESQEHSTLFNASTNAVHCIISSTLRSSTGAKFLTAAESDHFINVFHEDSPTLIGSLRTENEITSLDLYSRLGAFSKAEKNSDLTVRMVHPQEALAALNKDGVLEIFPEPFDFGSASSNHESGNLKARMKQRTRKAAAQIRIRRPDKSLNIVPLLNASFQGSDIALAWTDGSLNLQFDTVRWRDEGTGNILLEEITDIVKAKSSAGVGAVVMNGVKDIGKSHVDESWTLVANGGDTEDVLMRDHPPEVIDISSGEEESEFEDDTSVKAGETSAREGKRDSGSDADVEMEDVAAKKSPPEDDPDSDAAPGQDEEVGEPTFGDLIQANAPEAVDVQASFKDPNAQSLVPASDQSLQQLPSGMSLGTVLTQSLRTNDTNLLETCFHVKDLVTVRATIERLDSSFATVLLQRLAERLHSRPGRAGSLMVWIQWTLIAHGGYLAGQPEVMKKLASLHRVVKDRANSLQSLLSLKGKLDMLEAQMNLRKSMQVRSRAATAVEEDEEEGVIYVEGQEESTSEEEAQDQIEQDTSGSLPAAKAKAQYLANEAGYHTGDSDADSDEEDSEDAMPTTVNGIANAEDEDSDSEEEGLFDDEASSTDNDSEEGASDDDIDHDSIDTDSSDADTSPPPKRPAKSNRLSNGVRPKKS